MTLGAGGTNGAWNCGIDRFIGEPVLAIVEDSEGTVCLKGFA